LKQHWTLLLVALFFVFFVFLAAAMTLTLVRDLGPSETVDAEIVNTKFFERGTGSRRGTSAPRYVSYGVMTDGQEFQFDNESLFAAVRSLPIGLTFEDSTPVQVQPLPAPVTVERSTILKGPLAVILNGERYRRSSLDTVAAGALLAFSVVAGPLLLIRAARPFWRSAALVTAVLFPLVLWSVWVLL